MVLIGIYSNRITKSTTEDYFLASRKINSLLIFISFLATNLSSYFFLGFAGVGYKYGWGQYAMMTLGMSIFAFTFYIIGKKVSILGEEHKFVTPSELLEWRYNSRLVGLLTMFFLVIYTLPYLAVQGIGGGIILNSVSGMPVKEGALLVLLVPMIYLILGGMRCSVLTDIVQTTVMVVGCLFAVYFVAQGLGGFEVAGLNAYAASPELFTRPGGEGYFTLNLWFSLILLWFFLCSMYPHMFTRVYSAKRHMALKTTMILYPVILGILYFCPVAVGVWAHGTNIYVSNPDQVLPIMVKTYAPEWVYVIVMFGALAALMSTADSQLLAMSTMLSRDLKLKSDVKMSRVITVGLVILTFAFLFWGIDQKSGIFDILLSTTFSGYSVLFPVFLAALYFPKTSSKAAIMAIIMGEGSVFLFKWNILPRFGFGDFTGALFVASFTLIVVDYIVKLSGNGER